MIIGAMPIFAAHYAVSYFGCVVERKDLAKQSG